MSKLEGSLKRCKYCTFYSKRQYNVERHTWRKHFNREYVERQSYITQGVYKCCMHSVPLIYQNRRQLKRHLYFVHRADSD